MLEGKVALSLTRGGNYGIAHGTASSGDLYYLNPVELLKGFKTLFFS